MMYSNNADVEQSLWTELMNAPTQVLNRTDPYNINGKSLFEQWDWHKNGTKKTDQSHIKKLLYS